MWETSGDDFSWGDDSTNCRSEEHIRHLHEEDRNCEGDGGMSDEEGEGYDTVALLTLVSRTTQG